MVNESLNNSLLNEYKNLAEEKADIHKRQAELPKGYLQKKVIKGKIYYYLQYRDSKTVRTEYVPTDKLESIKDQLAESRSNKQRLAEINADMSRLARLLGYACLLTGDASALKPVRSVDYDAYTEYMSFLAHELKRLGKDSFVDRYKSVHERGIKARYLHGLLNHLTGHVSAKPRRSNRIILDPLSYQFYFKFHNKEVYYEHLSKALPAFLDEGLLITQVQEAVDGTFN